MTLRKLIEMGFVDNLTTIYAVCPYSGLRTSGCWTDDVILWYLDEVLTSFSWMSDNQLYIYTERE